MKAAGALICFTAFASCAHQVAPAGWDCRASVQQDGIHASAWHHLGRAGRVEVTLAQWLAQPGPAGILRIATLWQSNDGRPIDWDSGTVELIFQLGPRVPLQARRLELHGAAGPLARGEFGRRPTLLLSFRFGDYRRAVAAQPLRLVVVAEQTGEALPTGVDLGLLERGLGLASGALANATAKMSDYRNLCDKAPVIIPT